MTGIFSLKQLSKSLGLAPHPIVSLNIQSNVIRYIAIEGQNVIGWGEQEIDEEVVRDGLITSPKEVGKAIAEIVSQLPLTSTPRIVSTVSGTRSLPRLIEIPNIDRKLLEEAVRFESERQMPLPLNELYLSKAELEGSDSAHLFYVVGIPHALIESHMESFELSGTQSYEIDLKPLAISRIANRRNALLLDLEPGYTEIVLVTDGIPVLIRTIIMGGMYMPIEERVRQVAVEASRTIDYHNSSNPDSHFGQDQPMFLTGKLAYSNSLVELLKSALPYSIEQIEPDLELPERFPVSEYAVNLGLLKKRPLGEKKKRSDSFPAFDLEIAPRGYNLLSSPMKTLLVGLLAALVLILLIPMVKFDRDRAVEAAQLNMELQQVNQSLNEVRELSKSVRETRTEASQVMAETDAMLRAGSFSNGLDSVFRSVPGNVTLSSVSVSSTLISVSGISRDRTAVLRYASSIEAENIQSSVQITSLTLTDNELGESIHRFAISITR